MRLRKKVGAAERLQRIAAVAHEDADVSRLRIDVTRDVDDLRRTEGDELAEEGVVAALARRIDEDRRLRRRELDRLPHQPCRRSRAHLKDGLGVAGDEGGVRQIVELGVVRRGADAVGADLDAGDEVELVGEGDAEQTGAAVGVDEEARRSRRVVERRPRRELRADVVDERLENAVVALEEGAGSVLEAARSARLGDANALEARDTLANVALVVGLAVRLVTLAVGPRREGVSEQECRAPLEGLDRRPDARSLSCQAGLDDVGRDGTFLARQSDRSAPAHLDVEDVPSPFLLEADGHFGVLAGRIEVRRELGPIAVLQRRRQRRIDHRHQRRVEA